TFTSTGKKIYTAVVAAANSADEAEHSDTAEEVLAALVVEFKHAVSGTIGENFSVGMSLDLSALPDGTDLSGLKVVVSTKTGTRELPVGADGKIDIVLNPEELTMPLNPELYCGSTKLDDRSDNPNFSAAAYIKALASSDQATPEMKAMLTGLLEYGAAAQQYFNYRLNDLANADAYKFEGYGAPDYADPAKTDQNYAAGTDVRIRYANLYLQNDKVLIQFNVVAPVGSEYTLTDELSASVNGTTDQLSYTVRTGALNMSDLAGKVYTLVVTNGSDESHVTYSVANYVYNKVHDDNTGEAMKNLAKALWVYSNAAGAYAVATP
ncbi:MAG: hypothetical protein IK088_06015, partial [Lachnospiraceae bacterium]|nr:hypothetical protein [Lachnospiraceae bacterium]